MELTNQLQWYLSRLEPKVLKSTEVIDLIKKYHAGDLEAYNQLVSYNLKLVVSVAKKYTKNEEMLLDCIQAGNMGLMKAIEYFDLEKECKFSTYAIFWIRHYIIRYRQNNDDTIRISVPTLEHMTNLKKKYEELPMKLGHTPTQQELMRYLKLSENQFKIVSDALNCQNITSLDDGLWGTDQPIDQKIIDSKVQSAVEYVNSVVLKEMLLQLIQQLNLPEKKKSIIFLLYGMEDGVYKSMEEVAKILGITRQNVWQVNRDMLSKVRKQIKVEDYIEYLADDQSEIEKRLMAMHLLHREDVKKYHNVYCYYPNHSKSEIDDVLQQLPKEMLENLSFSYDENWNRLKGKRKLTSQEREIRGNVFVEMEALLSEKKNQKKLEGKQKQMRK